MDTREAWLHRATDALRPRFVEVGLPLPERVHVSVGFGYGARAESGRLLGQAWARRASIDGVNHVFISPEIGDAATVLSTLMHELVHVGDDCAHGHRGPFAEAATRLGLEGPMTGTVAGAALAAEFVALSSTLGPYPHGALSGAVLRGSRVPAQAGEPRVTSGPTTQTTRMLKLVCPCCEYMVRTTAKWLAVGNPRCPKGSELLTD